MTDGLLDLADVRVSVRDGAADAVVVDLEPPPDGYSPGQAWIGAAVRGAEQALSELSRSHPTAGGRAVTIRQILGTVSDTRPPAVACAAGLAVWRAAAVDLPEPAVQWGRDLHLIYPSAV